MPRLVAFEGEGAQGMRYAPSFDPIILTQERTSALAVGS